MYCRNCSWELKLKFAHDLGTRTRFQAEIFVINVIFDTVYFHEIILKSSRNVSKTSRRSFNCDCITVAGYHNLKRNAPLVNIKPPRSSDTCMCQCIVSPLVSLISESNLGWLVINQFSVISFRHTKILSQENGFEYVVWNIAAVLFKP